MTAYLAYVATRDNKVLQPILSKYKCLLVDLETPGLLVIETAESAQTLQEDLIAASSETTFVATIDSIGFCAPDALSAGLQKLADQTRRPPLRMAASRHPAYGGTLTEPPPQP